MKKVMFLFQLIIPCFLLAQVSGYDNLNIHGFDVYIEQEATLNDPNKTTQAINLLTVKLEEITNFGLLNNIVSELQMVKIFIDWDTTNGAAVYHPSLQWLLDNGYIEEKWKAVEISNITNFIDWTVLNQPYMVMHELAHAYHDQVLTYSYPPINSAYNNAMSNNLYDSVLYHAGNGNYFNKEAYATTNAREYFSELTEAFLGENDYYPFFRKELLNHDPTGYNVLSGIWRFETMNIVDNSLKNASIFPNPTSELLNINWKNTNGSHLITISTPQGSIIRTITSYDREQTTIDISSLASGIYYVLIDNNEAHKIVKLD